MNSQYPDQTLKSKSRIRFAHIDDEAMKRELEEVIHLSQIRYLLKRRDSYWKPMASGKSRRQMLLFTEDLPY